MSHLKLEIVSPGHADSELARHLDFTFERLEADGAVVRLPPSRAALDAPGSGRVDDRALIATADHCMGVAVHAALADKGPLATVDLKFEKFRPLEPGDVFLRVGRASIDSRLAFVAASLDQGVPERPVGHVSARFIVGAWPGADDEARADVTDRSFGDSLIEACRNKGKAAVDAGAPDPEKDIAGFERAKLLELQIDCGQRTFVRKSGMDGHAHAVVRRGDERPVIDTT